MGLGLLKDAAVRERRRRLLTGADMTAAVRRPRCAQLVNGERHTATARSQEEPRPETMMTGLHTNAHLAATATGHEPRGLEAPSIGCPTNYSSTEAGKFTSDATCKLGMHDPMEHEDASLVLQVEGRLLGSSNGPSESRPRTLLPGTSAAALIDGEQLTHHHAVSATSEEACGLPGQHTILLLSSATAAGKFSEVDSQDSDSDGNDSMMMPIFVRNGSRELTFTVRMDQCTKHLMHLYEERTKTTLDSQYFVYERKRLEPHHTWLSYGLKRDTTVHVCTRLLGGADGQNLPDFIKDNKKNFVKEVTLPDGRTSLQMTVLGCQFLSSWMSCFTAAFIQGRSWNGEFELVDFKFAEDHVFPIKKPKRFVESSSVGSDIIKLANEVKTIFTSRGSNLVSSCPPYVEACMKILRDLGATGQLIVVTDSLPSQYKTLLDTFVCCMTSNARERLIIELYRKYEGANQNEISLWNKAIDRSNCPATWRNDLTNDAIFGDLIHKANRDNKPYFYGKTGAFTLLRDVVMHATDHRGNSNPPKTGDGIELMIPANKHLKEFLPYIIKNLVENNVDISTELFAAINCACRICDSSH